MTGSKIDWTILDVNLRKINITVIEVNEMDDS